MTIIIETGNKKYGEIPLTKTNQILQRRRFGALNIRPQIGDFLFDPRIDFLDLQLLTTYFIPDPAYRRGVTRLYQ